MTRSGPGRVAGRPPGGDGGLRREVSLRLPSARLLEFTFEDPGADTPRVTMPDDGSLAAEQMSGREIVTTALALLRANYVFPELAEQAAVAVEARLAAGEYDDLDEITLTELVTSHLQEVMRGQAPEGAARRGRRPGRRPGPWPGPGPRPGPDPDAGAQGSRGQAAGHAPEGTAGQLRHTPGRAAGRQRRLPRSAPGRRPANAGPAIAAAMELVAGTYALIIDLRRNRGGSPEGVVCGAATCSTEQPTHLNDIFHADTGETRQFWACPTCRAAATSTGRCTC